MSKFLDKVYSKVPNWLQTFMVTLYGAKIHLERYSRKFEKMMEEFETNQWLSYEELINYQNEKLRKLLRHAYENVPYYRDRMGRLKLRPEDIRTVEDLHKLPVLTRAELKNNLAELRARNYHRWQLKLGHTSGTTGSPLEIWWDNQLCIVNNVVDWRQKHWAGLTYGDRIALAMGRIIVPLKQKEKPFWSISSATVSSSFSSFCFSSG